MLHQYLTSPYYLSICFFLLDGWNLFIFLIFINHFILIQLYLLIELLLHHILLTLLLFFNIFYFFLIRFDELRLGLNLLQIKLALRDSFLQFKLVFRGNRLILDGFCIHVPFSWWSCGIGHLSPERFSPFPFLRGTMHGYKFYLGKYLTLTFLDIFFEIVDISECIVHHGDQHQITS